MDIGISPHLSANRRWRRKRVIERRQEDFEVFVFDTAAVQVQPNSGRESCLAANAARISEWDFPAASPAPSSLKNPANPAGIVKNNALEPGSMLNRGGFHEARARAPFRAATVSCPRMNLKLPSRIQ
jgi:hypothetical protein